MKKFKEYLESIKNAKGKISAYPVKKNHNYTVAFVIPQNNSVEGIYRSLLPSYYMNELTTIRVIPVGISEQMDSLSMNQKQYEIKADLAEISDHIVLPFLSYPMEDLIIKPLKAINPKIKISYYIDFNYYFIPDSYPFVNEYSGAEIIANIEKNITLVDQVIVTNHSLYKFLHLELSTKEHIKGCNTQICYQPLFYDKTLFEDLPVKEESKPGKERKVRFGIVLNQTHFSDLNFIKGILKEFLKKNSDKAEIVVLGWNGEYKGKNYLNNIDVEYHAAVPFFDYFNKLASLNIDCFVIPAKVNKFNTTSKNNVKFYEFARLNVPIICPDIEAYQLIAKHNDNAVLCGSLDTWLFEMETFLKDPDKYSGLKDRAFTSILDNEISERDNIKILMDLYEI